MLAWKRKPFNFSLRWFVFAHYYINLQLTYERICRYPFIGFNHSEFIRKIPSILKKQWWDCNIQQYTAKTHTVLFWRSDVSYNAEGGSFMAVYLPLTLCKRAWMAPNKRKNMTNNGNGGNWDFLAAEYNEFMNFYIFARLNQIFKTYFLRYSYTIVCKNWSDYLILKGISFWDY